MKTMRRGKNNMKSTEVIHIDDDVEEEAEVAVGKSILKTTFNTNNNNVINDASNYNNVTSNASDYDTKANDIASKVHGGNRNLNSNNTTKSRTNCKSKKVSSKQQREDEQFLNVQISLSAMFTLAQYEIEVDAYRGIYDNSQSIQGITFHSSDISGVPYKMGQVGHNFDDVKDDQLDSSIESDCKNMDIDVSMSTNKHPCCSNIFTSCPCVRSWLLGEAVIANISSSTTSRPFKKRKWNGDADDADKGSDKNHDDQINSISSKPTRRSQRKPSKNSLSQDYKDMQEVINNGNHVESVLACLPITTQKDNNQQKNSVKNHSKEKNQVQTIIHSSNKDNGNINGNDETAHSHKSQTLTHHLENNVSNHQPEEETQKQLNDKSISLSTSIHEHGENVIISKVKRPSKNDCRCDYNPLCCTAMGGACDDYLNCKVFGTSSDKFQKQYEAFDQAWEQLLMEEEENQLLPDNGDSDYEEVQVLDHCPPSTQQLSLESKLRVEKMSKILYRLHTDERFTNLRLNFNDGEPIERTSHNNVLDLANSTEVPSSNNNFRKPINVSKSRIRNYLEKHIVNTLENEDQKDNLVSKIQEWNQSISYHHFVGNQKSRLLTHLDPSSHKENNRSKEDTVCLCKPVGLNNLGATCYLNSQLQCLSTNLLFLQGLFNVYSNVTSHESSSGQGRKETMIRAISKMQSLLAKMIYGAEDIVCTSEFASSLGLLNNEMQDPNEFNRLLFDRMNESFSQNGESFQLSTASTNGSQRSLAQLLPSTFQGSVEYATKCLKCNNKSCRNEAFMDLSLPIVEWDNTDGTNNKQKNVSVQDCLDKYFEPEMLMGSNQYFCGECNDKSDAERSVSISSSPSVLNLQLERYRYNIISGTKQKVMDQVVINRSLNLLASTGKSTKFILCAVQYHKGKSALSGHYVAEAMDWTTGTWFEFDDENVTVLSDGPSHSFYDEDESKKTKGTADAYNLFYVKESSLRESVITQLQLFHRQRIDNCTRTIKEASIERIKAYESHLSKILKEQEIQCRMNCRRFGIMKLFFEEGTQLQKNDHGFWVDGNMLRRFISCEDTMDDEISHNIHKPLLVHKNFICSHGEGLHPRDAHKGKLLNERMFESYLSLLKAEQQLIDQGKGSNTKRNSMELYDILITRENIRCVACEEAYRIALREKMEKMKLLVQLYTDLDPFNDIDIRNADNGTDEIYAVSRSFVSSFRAFVLKLMKDTSGVGSKNLDYTKVHFAGLDALELNSMLPWLTTEGQDTWNEAIDPTVNSKISCEHNNSNTLHNPRVTKYITKSTFFEIKKLFPNAIGLPVNMIGDMIEPCQLCAKKKVFEEELAGNMSLLVESHLELFALDSCSKNANNRCRVVPKIDVDNVFKISQIIKQKCPPKKGKEVSTGQAIKSKIEKILLDDDDQMRMALPNHSLICSHERSLVSSKLIASTLHSSKEDPLPIQVLPEEKFQLYVSFMSKLYSLIMGEDLSKNVSKIRIDMFPKVNMLTERIDMHPQTCSYGCEIDKVFSNDIPKATEDEQSGELILDHLCDHEESTLLDIDDDEKRAYNEPTFMYKVYQLDQISTIPLIKSLLEKHSSDKVNDLQLENCNNSRRRSSRIRNSAPWSLLTKFEEPKCNTLAHFRLRINEILNSNTDIVYQNLAFFRLLGNEYVIQELSHDSDAKQMIEVLDSFKNDKEIEVMLYYKLSEKRSKKDNKSKSEESNEELMDKLLFIATTDSETRECYHPKAKKKRIEERGFQGTLLL